MDFDEIYEREMDARYGDGADEFDWIDSGLVGETDDDGGIDHLS